MGKYAGNLLVSDFIQESLDFSYSVPKFITYCGHLLEELDRGFDFNTEGYRGVGYTSIILQNFGYNVEHSLGLEYVILALSETLKSDVLDDNLDLFSQAYKLYRGILKHSETNQQADIDIINKKGEKLFSGNYTRVTPEECKELQGVIQTRILECIYCTESLCRLLEVLARGTSLIYIGRENDIIHPKHQDLVEDFHHLLEQNEKSDIAAFDERRKNLSEDQDERMTDHDITSWYNTIHDMNVEKQVLTFGIFLLKRGDFDFSVSRRTIKENLISLAKKIDSKRVVEIENHIFEYYFDTDFEQETSKALDVLLLWEKKSIQHRSFLDEYVNFLHIRQIITQDELIDIISSEDEDAMVDALHHILSCNLLGQNKISNPLIRRKCIKFCSQYVDKIQKEADVQAEAEVLLYEESDESLSSELLKLLDKGIVILEHIDVLGGELIDYDVYELITLCEEEGIINPDLTNKLEDSDDKSFVIYTILQEVLDTKYLDSIGRGKLVSKYASDLYSLNMLFIG